LKKAVVTLILQEDKIRPENLLPLLELWVIHFIGQESFSRSFLIWSIIHAISGFWLISTSLIASHHHPDIYHAGDTPRKSTDWGLRQMDSTRDVTNKTNYYFLVATTFGDHTLHHLFPTVDHSKLHLLYPALEETCKEFGITYQTLPQSELFLGMHSQLMRTKGKENFVK